MKHPFNMKFWETPEYVKLKTKQPETDKLLTRVEYLKLVGYKNYSEEEYQKYVKSYSQPKNKNNS